jgi:hypothetical protein
MPQILAALAQHVSQTAPEETYNPRLTVTYAGTLQHNVHAHEAGSTARTHKCSHTHTHIHTHRVTCSVCNTMILTNFYDVLWV